MIYVKFQLKYSQFDWSKVKRGHVKGDGGSITIYKKKTNTLVGFQHIYFFSHVPIETVLLEEKRKVVG